MTDIPGSEPTSSRLSGAEDAVLRRLWFFAASGAVLAPPVGSLLADLRARDQRDAVRDPRPGPFSTATAG